MSSANDLQVLVFDKAGFHPVDIAPQINHIAWRLNRIGVCKFSLPYEDPKCTPDILKSGNRVLVRFLQGLPPFGGVIDYPFQRTATGVQVTVYSAEHILTWRETSLSFVIDALSPGVVFRTVIENANSVAPTGITVGSVYTSGNLRTETYHYANLWTLTQSLQAQSGEDFHIAPIYEGGRLTFRATWHSSLGDDLSASVLLVEDRNLESLTLDEQGPIANYVIAAGSGAGGTTWEDRVLGTAQDTDSISEYGRRDQIEVLTGIADQTTLDTSAAVTLAQLKDPRPHVSAVALDKGPADFSRYKVGDTVQVNGFLKHSLWAIDQPLRILGREWRPDNRCSLELA
jgi:hypothetical protein